MCVQTTIISVKFSTKNVRIFRLGGIYGRILMLGGAATKSATVNTISGILMLYAPFVNNKVATFRQSYFRVFLNWPPECETPKMLYQKMRNENIYTNKKCHVIM